MNTNLVHALNVICVPSRATVSFLWMLFNYPKINSQSIWTRAQGRQLKGLKELRGDAYCGSLRRPEVNSDHSLAETVSERHQNERGEGEH